jgi:spore germination protein GerM
LLATTVDAGVATIELGERIQRVHGRPYSELVYWSIVFTATEAPGVEAVRLLYRGVPLTELGAPPFAVPSEGRREAAPAWARPRSADAR